MTKEPVQGELMVTGDSTPVTAQQPAVAPVTTGINDILMAAMQNGMNADMIERLLDIRAKEDAREAEKLYVKAMAQFKKNPPKIIKSKSVAFNSTKYKHATIGDVSEKINAALSEHGLAASWSTEQNGDSIKVTCSIRHEAGHKESTSLIAAADKSGGKNSIQGVGSTVTYLQRYTILALTGLATHDEDTDGRQPVQTVTDQQVAKLTELLESGGRTVESVTHWCKVQSLHDIPAANFNYVYNSVKNSIEGQQQ